MSKQFSNSHIHVAYFFNALLLTSDQIGPQMLTVYQTSKFTRKAKFKADDKQK